MSAPDPLGVALDGYAPADAREHTDIARVRALLETPDPWARALPLHVTASAVVVAPESRRVLLRWHARMQRWLHVGGHGDPGERDPWEVARREAVEETSLRDLVALGPTTERRPVQVVVVPVPPRGDEPAHEHADIRYALVTSRPDDAMAESRDAPLRWLAMADALAEVEEDNLRECLRRVDRLLG